MGTRHGKKREPRTKHACATMICVKDENMVIWSTGDNFTTASLDAVLVTQNRRIEIAHRHIRPSVILKTSLYEVTPFILSSKFETLTL
jgi:hypothetical protein